MPDAREYKKLKRWVTIVGVVVAVLIVAPIIPSAFWLWKFNSAVKQFMEMPLR